MKRHTNARVTRLGYGSRATAVSILPLILATPAAWAQAAVDTADEAAVQSAQNEIVVTGTRIQSAGFAQPTPVTSVTADQLMLNAPGSLSESLAPLPGLRLSTNPQGGQGASANMGGISQLNLRGLGPNRTLVLLNGHRLTPASTGSAPDINMLPQQLMKRVDLVTGGASAAYGSDAVAGVVNFILDEDFRGFKGEIQRGITSRGDGESFKVGGAIGLHLLDNRLHIIASAEYYDRKGVRPTGDRAWTQGHYLPLTNPAVSASNPASLSNPNFIIAPDATIANQTAGGLIASGPLAGTQFVNGQPVPFAYGALRTGAFMQGGDGLWPGDIVSLALPLRRHNVFVQTTF
ncbi:MAG TPA: TonB-dependent receptor plug domain-containing protein, partial [Sphingomonadaceae bacterium]|nr:TonB-dependent receptor plug domain-containing protein [Sphingomonadaceae bacterium]